jgi:KDO2-lipid IV(A) lauroyltransferase
METQTARRTRASGLKKTDYTKMMHNELRNKDKRYRESLLRKILNNTLVAFLIVLSWLPFWILYGISNVFYVFIRYVVKYRYRVISDNLKHAFPEKPEAEIRRIRNRFYQHFADVFVETIKAYSISEKQIEKRVVIKGMDGINACYNRGANIAILAMHHNNWEWGSFVQRKTNYTGLMIYDPVRGNQAFEKFLVKYRTRWGGMCVPVHKSARTIVELKRIGNPVALWLGADQTPPASSKFWTIFLNRETPFFTGPEKIAAKTNQPVFFHHTRKTGRGKYEINFIPLIENPRDSGPNEILLRYVQKMEEIIREEPEYYLWSHRRWKHKRPENIPIISRKK